MRWIFVVACFGILTGCGKLGDQLPASAAVASARAPRLVRPAAQFQLLHAFQEHTGGVRPFADVTTIDGTLYGTTSSGGTGSRMCGCGVVYAIDASGLERVVYRFLGATHAKNPAVGDGATPLGGLTKFNGQLYGTTSAGGNLKKSAPCPHAYAPGCGTVYRIDASGNERVVYRFHGGQDGATPVGNLVVYRGKLFGVTSGGGSRGSYECGSCGTIFSISASGAETVVHRFTGRADGGMPQAGLSVVNGILYGTATIGGSKSKPCLGADTCGTVFTVSPSHQLRVLYAFSGGAHGGGPDSTLVNVDGVLYGTTQYAGNRANCGTIFALDSTGSLTTPWLFGCSPDGANPRGSLVVQNGIVYGSTRYGGANSCRFGRGCGTVFAFDPKTSQESPIYSLRSADGVQPIGITLANGILYGTAYEGGGGGEGTVFSVTP